MIRIKLVVIRTNRMEQLAEFYSLVGFQFNYHKHGGLPYHYSAANGELVLEIYPLAKNQTESDPHLRLGFAIENFETVIDSLIEKKVKFHAEPTQTDFGFLAIVEDPDGRKIELYQE